MQIDLDLDNSSTAQSVQGYSTARLEQIRAWQDELGIAVLPLSSAQDTTAQVRRLMGRAN